MRMLSFVLRKIPGRVALTAGLTALLAAAPAAGTIVDLTASMDCAQANAGAGTCGLGGSGTGTASIILDTDSNLLSWNVGWSGLSSPATLMHFHGPALPNQNAGVQVGIGVGSNPAIGNAVISNQQETDLLDGLWYVNLHTTSFSGGEIRGQVTIVPEPSTLTLLAGGLLLFAGYRRNRRS
jgi:hypothetical protein